MIVGSMARSLRKVVRTCKVAFAVLLVGTATGWSEETSDLDAIAGHLVPEKVAKALVGIPDESRKLLALRSYVRFSGDLDERWSWTEEEIAAFRGTDAQLALQAEIDAIGADFSERNPGHEIYVHSSVRSLDTQIAHWNENDSVGLSAWELHDAWRESEAASIDPADPDALRRFRSWLKGFDPASTAHIAAPGLSRHGRAHAIDFQVMKNGEIIAGTDYEEIETVWKEGGWGKKLKESVTAAGPSFSGPLASPHEPWHYDYAPDPVRVVQQ